MQMCRCGGWDDAVCWWGLVEGMGERGAIYILIGWGGSAIDTSKFSLGGFGTKHEDEKAPKPNPPTRGTTMGENLLHPLQDFSFND